MSIYRVASKTAISVGHLNKIESYAIHYDWNLAFNGRSRGNMHLFRTVGLVGILWENLHPGDDDRNDEANKAELDVAVAGGLLHDIGLVYGNEGHCFSGKKLAGEILNDIGIGSGIMDKILHCIECHDGEVQATSVAAMLVHDADTLDKLGPLGAIRHIWKLSLLGSKDYSAGDYHKLIPVHLLDRYNKLYLDQSKKLGAPLNDARAEMFKERVAFDRLVEHITGAAREGIPVDILLEGSLKTISLPESVIKILEAQIDPSYLDI